MAGSREDEDFAKAILCTYPLDEAIEWIGMNMCPEDVFSDEQLKSWAKNWAIENNYIFEREAK